MTTNTELRAQFDIDVTFRNGGGLRAEAFRLDIAAADVSDAELGELFVHELGLLMVDRVGISNRTLIREPHKGLRNAPASTRTAAQYFELSHEIRHGMVTYPGIPGPEIGVHMSREASRATYAPDTEFEITRISLVANTGTYLDAPAHRFADGADLAGLPLSILCDLDGVVVRVPGDAGRAIDRALLLPYDVGGRAVLLHTGWDQHFGTDQYFSGHPYLTEDGAAWLADQGAALVGIDSLNIDDTAGGTRPAHTTLLRAGIPIVEHLRGLDQLPPHGFRFSAAPPRVVGMGTFPVRAYAVVEGS